MSLWICSRTSWLRHGADCFLTKVVAPLLLGGVSLMMTVTGGLLTLNFIHPMAVFSSWCAEHKGTKSSFASLCDAASPNMWVIYWWLFGMVLLILCSFSALEILFPSIQGFKSCMSWFCSWIPLCTLWTLCKHQRLYSRAAKPVNTLLLLWLKLVRASHREEVFLSWNQFLSMGKWVEACEKVSVWGGSRKLCHFWDVYIQLDCG